MMSFYRAFLRIPPAYASAIRAPAGAGGQQRFLVDVAHRLGWLGMRPVQLVVQDPTDASRLTAIGCVEKVDALKRSDGVMNIEAIEPIAAPPEPEPPSEDPGLDAGLNRAEASAVRYALERDMNPRHLTGFASTLEPWFPVAASHLRVRSALLEPGAHFRDVEPRAVSHEQLDDARSAIERDATRGRLPLELARIDVKCAILRLVQEPHLPNLARTSAERGAALAVRPVVVRTTGGPTEVLRVADAARVLRLLPPEPRDGFVSPTALQLAMASTGKPEISGVLYRQLAPKRVQAIENNASADPEARIELMYARDALHRAERCLERCRYVRWYEKVRTA